MMRKGRAIIVIMTYLVFCLILSCKGQNRVKANLDETEFDSVVSDYIKVVFNSGNKSTNSYKVFVIRGLKTDSGMCFSLGYIMNRSEFKLLGNPDFYKKYRNKYLVYKKTSSEVKFPYKQIGFVAMEEDKKDEILKVLEDDSGLSGFTYNPSGLIYCPSKKKPHTHFYKNELNMPRGTSVID